MSIFGLFLSQYTTKGLQLLKRFFLFCFTLRVTDESKCLTPDDKKKLDTALENDNESVWYVILLETNIFTSVYNSRFCHWKIYEYHIKNIPYPFHIKNTCIEFNVRF